MMAEAWTWGHLAGDGSFSLLTLTSAPGCGRVPANMRRGKKSRLRGPVGLGDYAEWGILRRERFEWVWYGYGLVWSFAVRIKWEVYRMTVHEGSDFSLLHNCDFNREGRAQRPEGERGSGMMSTTWQMVV